MLSTAARKLLSGVCFGLGALWGLAGALKVLFGVRVGLVLLPPLDLTAVAPGIAFVVALGFLTLGALLGRTGRRMSEDRPAGVRSRAPSA